MLGSGLSGIAVVPGRVEGGVVYGPSRSPQITVQLSMQLPVVHRDRIEQALEAHVLPE